MPWIPIGTPRLSWHGELPSQPTGSIGAVHHGGRVAGTLGGQAFTTFPSRSNSMTEGEGWSTTVSGETRFVGAVVGVPLTTLVLPWGPRLTVKTWSCESTVFPATSPVTQGLLAPGPVLRKPSVAAAGLVSASMGSG